LIRYFVHRGGRTETADRLDPAWLSPDSGAVVWADVAEPTDADGAVLREEFGLHELVVEAAFQRETQPKVESYGRYLYVVLHGINFSAAEHSFETHETDFFLAANFLVTVHDGQRRHRTSRVCPGRSMCSKAPARCTVSSTPWSSLWPEVDESRSG
jgi:Mg2+ and Co2+ transporter CorA